MKFGGKKDEEAMQEAICSGVKLLLTAHGDKIEDVSEKIKETGIFKYIVVLKNEKIPGELAKIYFWEGNKYVNCI